MATRLVHTIPDNRVVHTFPKRRLDSKAGILDLIEVLGAVGLYERERELLPPGIVLKRAPLIASSARFKLYCESRRTVARHIVSQSISKYLKVSHRTLISCYLRWKKKLLYRRRPRSPSPSATPHSPMADKLSCFIVAPERADKKSS